MLKRENALSEDMSEHVQAMGQGLVVYATKVLASIDGDKPMTIKAAYVALRSIDVFREAAQTRAASGETAVETPEASPDGAGG